MLDRKSFVESARKVKRTYIKILKKEKYRGGVMICAHNSILCVQNKESGKIDFIIDPDKPRGMTMLEELDEHLAVPRYTPKTAKEWLKEPLQFNGLEDDDYLVEFTNARQKVVLSEYQLREELKKNLESLYKTYSETAKYLKDNPCL